MADSCNQYLGYPEIHISTAIPPMSSVVRSLQGRSCNVDLVSDGMFPVARLTQGSSFHFAGLLVVLSQFLFCYLSH